MSPALRTHLEARISSAHYGPLTRPWARPGLDSGSGSLVVQGTAPWRSAGFLLGCRGLAEYRKTAFAAFPVTHGSGSIKLVLGQPLNEASALNREPGAATVGHLGADAVWPNNSLNPRLATAGLVSPVCASRTIVAARAYKSCLHSRG